MPDVSRTRLKKEATYVKINNRSITELVDMPISELKIYFDNLQLSEHDKTIAARVLLDIIIGLISCWMLVSVT